jgi:hypothetical protein
LQRWKQANSRRQFIYLFFFAVLLVWSFSGGDSHNLPQTYSNKKKKIQDKMELMKYKYYDSPEGQDVFAKMFYTSKQCSKAGK